MTIDVYDVVHLVTQLMETYKRYAGFTELEKHDSFAKPGDFLEITSWYNGEGFDVHLSTQAGEQRMSFTWGEYKALYTLSEHLFGNMKDEGDEQ
jgi:hypothetical protein